MKLMMVDGRGGECSGGEAGSMEDEKGIRDKGGRWHVLELMMEGT